MYSRFLAIIVACVCLVGVFPMAATADSAVCGQWVEGDCALARVPVFLPCGSNEPWFPDPEALQQFGVLTGRC